MLLLVPGSLMFAQLPGDPKSNSAVCVGPGDKWAPAIAPDRMGGAVVAWQDDRNGNYDIFAQKVDMLGKIQWTAEGVAVCPDTKRQGFPKLVEDGTGGAIVTWCDDRSGNCDVFAQRVDANGAVAWSSGGVPVSKVSGGRTAPAIVGDGMGGAIIAWHEKRTGSYDIYVQRIDASGKMKWGSGGLGVCTMTADQLYPVLSVDGAGGAIIAWDDNRNGSHDVYAQRVSSSGGVEWTPNGVAVCTAAGNQQNPAIIPNGSGGAIVVWHDQRSGTFDIYSQMLSESGEPMWGADGIPLCQAKGDQSSPALTSDGKGGAIVVWCDKRGSDYDIYSQRVNASGKTQWGPDGVLVCSEGGDQMLPALVSDGFGGAIMVWHDNRDSSYDIYAERLDAAGAPQWQKNGVAICTAQGDQSCPTIAADGTGGAIITWSDPRNNRGDVFVQRVDGRGVFSSVK